MSMMRFAIVDTETTGLSCDNDRLLQIGVVVVCADGQVENQFATYIKRRILKPGHLGAHFVHGITRSDLRNGIPASEALVAMQEMIAGCVFTAHNAQFDLGFLRAEANRANVLLAIDAPICTLKMSRALDPKLTMSHKLSEIAKRYGVVNERAHDALADAKVTAAVLPRLLGELGITTVEQLSPFVVTPNPLKKFSGVALKHFRRGART